MLMKEKVENLYSVMSPFVYIDPFTGRCIDTYDIYDNNGYRLLSNIDRDNIKELKQAVKEYNISKEPGRNVLIIKDINVYASISGKVMVGKDDYISIWTKEKYYLEEFWNRYENLKKEK